MKKIFTSIINFFKGLFDKDISININKKYDVKKNKNCNININDRGDVNEKNK